MITYRKKPHTAHAIWGFSEGRLAAAAATTDAETASGKRSSEHVDDGASTEPHQDERNSNADHRSQESDHIRCGHRALKGSDDSLNIDSGISRV